MTDKEKAVVMAYTGIAMLTGDKFDIFHKYVEDIMGRPVFTHEFATCAEEIKEKSKPDFLKLCAEKEQSITHCKDCEYFRTPEKYSYKEPNPYCCRSALVKMSENDFCSKAKKRGEAE